VITPGALAVLAAAVGVEGPANPRQSEPLPRATDSGPVGMLHPGRGAERGYSLEGEYGLYVGINGNSLDVRWITEAPRPGVLRVWADGELLADVATQAGTAHAATVDLTRFGGDRVLLEYGRPGQLYQTAIRTVDPWNNPVELPAPDELYVVGDLHGQLDRFTELLSGAGLIDENLSWAGGQATLALLGDMMDRGPDVTPLLWFLYRLEEEAEQAGGSVLPILGNHELLVFANDLRYVESREILVSDIHGLGYAEMFEPRSTVLGRWIASLPPLVRVGDLLLAHGGAGPEHAAAGLVALRDSMAVFLREPLMRTWFDTDAFTAERALRGLDDAAILRRWRTMFGETSVFWTRELVTEWARRHETSAGGAVPTEASYGSAPLRGTLLGFGAEALIVAHTPVEMPQIIHNGRVAALGLAHAASAMLRLVPGERDQAGRAGWKAELVRIGHPPRPIGILGAALPR